MFAGARQRLPARRLLSRLRCTRRRGRHIVGDRCFTSKKNEIADEATRRRVDELRALLTLYNEAYYGGETPLVSDSQYDALFVELQQLESRHAELWSPTSPTETVAYNVITNGVAHLRPMISLQSLFKISDLHDFVERCERSSIHKWTAEHKFDGMALALRYEDGRLKSAVTRGDGQRGDEVTELLRIYSKPPLEIASELWRSLDCKIIEIRAEALIRKAEFTSLVTTDGGIHSPRNLVAGILRSKITTERRLKPTIELRCYNMVLDRDAPSSSTSDRFDSHSERLRWLASAGFEIDTAFIVTNSADALLKFFEDVKRERDQSEFECDGVVVKVDSLEAQQRLGSTSRFPRWAIALKFAAKTATTEVEDIEFSVGRTGKVTPVAILKPCSIGSVTISRATLHNVVTSQRLALRAGDVVEIERAGDVIPLVRSVVSRSKRTASSSSELLALPTDNVGSLLCPCEQKSTLRREDDRPDYFCESITCPRQTLRKISYFASSEALDIAGFGPSTVSVLLEHGLIEDAPDLFELHNKQEALLKLPRFEQKRVQSLLRSIERCRNQCSALQVLVSLGIPSVGRNTAELLLNHFGSIRRILSANEDELKSIKGVGPNVVSMLTQHRQSVKDSGIFERLVKARLRPLLKEEPAEPTKLEGDLKGEVIAISGSIPGMKRSELKMLLKSRGARVASQLTTATTLLILGTLSDHVTKKLKDARKLGIRIVEADDYMKQLDLDQLESSR